MPAPHRAVGRAVALKAKTLADFQASYDVPVKLTILRERLQLQTGLLRRDMEAMNMTSLRKQQANRAKAQRSTCHRTAAGRAVAGGGPAVRCPCDVPHCWA